MFEAINELPYPSISYSTTLPTHIPSHDQEDNYQLSLNHKLQGYLDDTTWLTDNISNLEKNLAIADDFYQLANIKLINKNVDSYE
jgi:hypothetical protein